VRKLGLVLLLLAGLGSIAAGLRYLLASEFMPYHAVVSGKAWSQLEPGVQVIILGMCRILGGGIIAFGAALLWLQVPLRRNELWARWCVLTLTALLWVPTQYVTLVLKAAAPRAEPPILPTAIVLLLVIVGIGCLFAQRPAPAPAHA
jgi:hypothetical protein